MQELQASLMGAVPWLLLMVSALAAWFRRARATRLSALLLLFWFFGELAPTLDLYTEQRTFIITSLLPFLALFLALFPSRGAWRWPTLVFWGLLAFCGLLLQYGLTTVWPTLQWLVSGIVTVLGGFLSSVSAGVIVLLLAAIVHIVRWVWRANPVDSGLSVSCLFFAMALHHIDSSGPQGSLLLIAAALVLLLALVHTAWRMAYLDGLTSLPNRRALEQALHRSGRSYAVAMIDVDHFKKVNDRFGHETGDQVLRKIASQLSKAFPGAAYRYGGEEFSVIVKGRKIRRMPDRLEALRESIAASPMIIRSKDRPSKRPKNPDAHRRSVSKIPISVSMGYAIRERSQSHHSVIAAADQALYEAKKTGRNKVVKAK